MRASRGDCHFCAQPVLSIETAAWPVVGWEAERGRGGANQIIGRERVLDGRIAHAACAKRAAERSRRGIAHAQESLI
jgi:hypothetical protein